MRRGKIGLSSPCRWFLLWLMPWRKWWPQLVACWNPSWADLEDWWISRAWSVIQAVSSNLYMQILPWKGWNSRSLWPYKTWQRRWDRRFCAQKRTTLKAMQLWMWWKRCQCLMKRCWNASELFLHSATAATFLSWRLAAGARWVPRLTTWFGDPDRWPYLGVCRKWSEWNSKIGGFRVSGKQKSTVFGSPWVHFGLWWTPWTLDSNAAGRNPWIIIFQQGGPKLG